MALPRVQGGKIKRDMRWQGIRFEAGHALNRLMDQSKPFGHQRRMEPEEGGHASVGVDRHAARLEKGGNAGIALARRDKAPATDHTRHGKRLAVLGDPVGKNDAGGPVVIAKRQRGGGLAAERDHDVQPFQLAAEGGCLFDIAVIILCQEGLPQQRHVAGVVLQRAKEEVRRLADIIEIECLAGSQIMPRRRGRIV